MKVSKLMLGLAFVACAGLMLTSCKKKKGDDLTIGESRAAFLAADETMAALETDMQAQPAIQVIDKLLSKTNGYKAEGQNPHLSMKYYQDFFMLWKDKNLVGGSGYALLDNGTLDETVTYLDTAKNDDGTIKEPMEVYNLDLNQIIFMMSETDTATIQYSGNSAADGKLSTSASIFYPDSKTSVFSTMTCTLEANNRDNGDMNFTFPSAAGYVVSYNTTTTNGVPVPGGSNITIGAGSYVRWLFVQRNATETVYGLKDIHGQAVLGLFSKDKMELRWGNVKLYIDATTKVTKDTKIEIKAFDADGKECNVGTLNAESGVITYVDGGQTGQASADCPKLYAHLKEIFNIQ